MMPPGRLLERVTELQGPLPDPLTKDESIPYEARNWMGCHQP